ncbi:hypothetical protein AUR64_01770 [Haloprofundus marisrubri]|uniref:DNA modification methylase n=1 Tax=Haloprofundus marisrubri TaxID=1514971 RepID=A0A0W1R537_9EURY|nr:hypothetical protein [Haloprofundus marisrubri]KTG07984.1 hypothetical protein AUR64_01770 [Haloprofundus marisrubri]
MSDDADGSSSQTTLTGEVPEELTTDDLILSAHRADNDAVFPKVLDLHVETGAKVADVTYGKGVFWKNVPDTAFDLHGTDLDPEKSPTGESVDCRDLPYDDNSFDVVVLDPPYAEGFFRRNKEMLAGGDGSHSTFREHYSNGEVVDTRGSKYHGAVIDLYCAAGAEAKRVLRDDGTLIVKTQDEVSANTQELTHVQIINFYESQLGLYTKDLFVTVRSNTPAVSGVHTQVHARKNHSYFLVFTFEKKPANVQYAGVDAEK